MEFLQTYAKFCVRIPASPSAPLALINGLKCVHIAGDSSQKLAQIVTLVFVTPEDNRGSRATDLAARLLAAVWEFSKYLAEAI